jgi:hypothetical protein
VVTKTSDARSIVTLLQRLDQQIVADRLLAPQNDNASQTLATIAGLLPRAPSVDLQLVINLPSHLAKRAQEEEVSGHEAEATRFRSLAGILSGGLQDQPSGETLPQSQEQVRDAPDSPSGRSAPERQASIRQLDPAAANALSTTATATATTVPDIPRLSGWSSSPTNDRSRLDPFVASSRLPTVFVRPPAPHKMVAPAPAPRPAVAPTPRVPVKATLMDPRCRSIAQKFEIGETPSEAEQGYLRKGC